MTPRVSLKCAPIIYVFKSKYAASCNDRSSSTFRPRRPLSSRRSRSLARTCTRVRENLAFQHTDVKIEAQSVFMKFTPSEECVYDSIVRVNTFLLCTFQASLRRSARPSSAHPRESKWLCMWTTQVTLFLLLEASESLESL